MQKRTKILTLVACGLAAGVAAVLLLGRENTPSYRGRSLPKWYQIWLRADQGFADAGLKTEAAHAIRQIGTNALPILLKQIRNQSPRMTATERLTETLPIALSQSRIARSFTPSMKPMDPVAIFRILGPQANQAIPELTALLNCPTNWNAVHTAARCLAAVGEDGLPPLVAAMANPQLQGCQEATLLLSLHRNWYFGTNLEIAVPPLAHLATNANWKLAFTSTAALGSIRLQPKIAVPALAQALQHQNSAVRSTAIHALAEFNKEATPAIPVLTRALRDHDYEVRSAATNVLLRIAPEYLTNTSAK